MELLWALGWVLLYGLIAVLLIPLAFFGLIALMLILTTLMAIVGMLTGRMKMKVEESDAKG